MSAPEEFEGFFRASYPKVMRVVLLMGASVEEAEDAAASALAEMLSHWPVGGAPLPYARKAAIRIFVKGRTRGNLRVVQRLIERGWVPN